MTPLPLPLTLLPATPTAHSVMASWFAKKFGGSSGTQPTQEESADGIPSYSNNPDQAWVKEKLVKHCKPLKPIDWSTPKPEGHTRFVCISDTHNHTDKGDGLKTPPGDVLLHAGDFTNVGLPKDVKKFVSFFTAQPHPHKVIIAGNHDLTFDSASYPDLWSRFGHSKMHDCEEVKDMVRKAPGVTYLEDSGTTINGISIWGSPWQPEFCNWAFNLPRGLPCKEKWDLIPEGTDVLITHGPPLGHGDMVQGGRRSGCLQLWHAVQRVRPKYHVFGHIHEGYGITTDDKTVFINASTCNFQYQPVQPAIIFDLPNRDPTDKTSTDNTSIEFTNLRSLKHQ